MLLDQGVTLIEQIPDDFPLTEAQARILYRRKAARPWISTRLSNELSRLKYPRYFMDFETLNPAIPRHAGMRPYQQIPFQWSVHRQMAPDAELEHFEFLADDGRDPRRDFVGSLIKVLGGVDQSWSITRGSSRSGSASSQTSFLNAAVVLR